MDSTRKFSIGKKFYIFIIIIVLVAVTGICTISYLVNANQIDNYYKTLTINNARNYATLLDVDFICELKEVAQSDEYQELRARAEELDDESLIEAYLREKGLWDRYVKQRNSMRTYVNNMNDVKYLYIVAWGLEKAEDGEWYDMYLLDADDVPLYQTGYYELREPEFEGVEPYGNIGPVISNGDWGWLCSGFAPVFDKYSNLACNIGCDVGMDDVMQQRKTNLLYILIGSVIYTGIVLIVVFFFINDFIVKPLNTLTSDIKKFSPKANKDYERSFVIPAKNRKRNDEIDDIYAAIRDMQIKLIDYVDNITKAEKDIKKISITAYRDSLTGIDNKSAYLKKANEINLTIKKGTAEFAVVMTDINLLKKINDDHGHDAGDTYIKGCCHLVCDVFKRSPVYRVGGDEFVAILTGEDYSNRVELVDELKRNFSDSFANKDVDPWYRYSASVGMAEYTEEDASIDAVFKRADRAMYEDKTEFKKKNGINPDERN